MAMTTVPGPFSGGYTTTTGVSPIALAQIDLAAFQSFGFPPVYMPVIIEAKITAMLASGLSINSAGVASLVRSFKCVNGSYSTLTNLSVIGGLGGVVVLNVAPLVGDLAVLGCTATLTLSGSLVTLYVTGTSGDVNWTAGLYVATGTY